MNGMSNSKIEAGLLYGAVFLVAVFWFDVRTDDLGTERQIMVPYFPVFYVLIVAAGAILAAYLSDLYLPDSSRWVTFASVAFQPVAVLLAASFLAALGLIVALHVGIRPTAEGADIFGVISLTLNALSVCLLFIALSWPVLLIGLAAVAALLWFRHGQAV